MLSWSGAHRQSVERKFLGAVSNACLRCCSRYACRLQNPALPASYSTGQAEYA